MQNAVEDDLVDLGLEPAGLPALQGLEDVEEGVPSRVDEEPREVVVVDGEGQDQLGGRAEGQLAHGGLCQVVRVDDDDPILGERRDGGPEPPHRVGNLLRAEGEFPARAAHPQVAWERPRDVPALVDLLEEVHGPHGEALEVDGLLAAGVRARGRVRGGLGRGERVPTAEEAGDLGVLVRHPALLSGRQGAQQALHALIL
mmetsp:Transcript_353/g.1434  ORF Transcript_353/g.1434 Transcript_353/m.1434 type:complete len:200 (+) Transcript_353:1805-2404(+)